MLFVIDGEYHDLDGSHMERKNWVYMQQNAPIHTSRKSTKWFTQNLVVLISRPANSPDLNP